MNLRLSTRRFRFGLSRKVGNAVLRFDEREGLEVSLLRDGTVVGVGEASPLRGYSDESIESCEAALEALDTSSLEAMTSAFEGHDLRAAAAVSEPLPGASRFGFECAVLEAVARRHGRSPSAWLGATQERALFPALLVDAFDGRDADAIATAFAVGAHGALKLKIGTNRARELELATLLRRALPANVELRFDANRSLRKGRDDAFVRSLAELGPCLIEEPFTAEELDHAFELTLPLALDESLRTASRDDVRSWIETGRVRALVLKPTILGLLESLALSDLARDAGGRAIPSHTYEGPIGRRFLTVFAQLCREPAPGLDVGEFRRSVADGNVAD